MKNIYYSSANFHKAIKRNNPKVVYSYQPDIWFYTQKAVIVYRANFQEGRIAMYDWLKKQGVVIDEH